MEHRRRNGYVTIRGETVAYFLDMLVNAECLLNYHNRRPTGALAGRRMADIGNHVQPLIPVHIVELAVTGKP